MHAVHNTSAAEPQTLAPTLSDDWLPAEQAKAEPNLFQVLHNDGYQVVPIIPRKKYPGQKVGDGWQEMTRWSKHQSTAEERARWHADGAGVGVVAGPDVLFMDIDIIDPLLADRAEKLATDRFGEAPLRVGQWPRRALVYRVETPFKKTTSGDPSTGAGVEFRTGPNQTVAYGIHPNGHQYHWPRPLVAKSQLPLVTLDGLRAFKADCDELLGSGGKKIDTDVDTGAVDQEKLKGPIELVEAAVRAIPNNDKTFNRDMWITACHAIAAASVEFPHEGYDLWMEFCERHPTFNEADATKTWETIGTTHRVGIDWLCQEALRYSDAFGQVLVDQLGWFENAETIEAIEAAEAEPEVASIDAPEESPGLFLFFEYDEDQIEPQDIFGYGDTAAVTQVAPGLFPTPIDNFVQDFSRRSGAPAAFVALSAIVVFQAAVGNKVRLQPKANDTSFTVPSIQWGMLAGGVGSMKTPSMEAALAPLAKVDEAKSRQGNQAYDEWERRKALAKTREEKASLPPQPKTKRNLTSDATQEAIGGMLADNTTGLLVYADEIMAKFGSLGAYKQKADGDRAQTLQLHNGGYLPVDRVNRRQRPVPFYGASILGSIQPDKIRKIAADLDDDGMLQRFLVVYVEDNFDLDADDEVDEAPDRAAAEAYDHAVTKWATANDELPPMVLTLSDAAQDVWRPLRKDIKALGHLQGFSDAWRGHVSKWAGLSARLLLACHLLNNTALETHEIADVKVSADTARQAVRLSKWFLANSFRFYASCIGGGQTFDDARWIAGHVLTRPEKTRFSRRDIGDIRHDMRGMDERIEQAMKLLENNGWVVPNMNSRLDSRRRPTQWTICPAVHDGRFASQAHKEEKERRLKQASILAAGRVRAEIMGDSSVFD